MNTNPVVIMDAEQVHLKLKNLDVISSMRDMFRSLGQGQAVQPPQFVSIFPDGKGDFITYFGVIAGQQVFGVKVSPYLVTTGSPVITAYTLLMSMETGQPLLMCDSKALTKERTAATTALAVEQLVPAGVKRLAVIGSGPIALAHLKYVLPLRNWDSVRISSLDLPQNSEIIKPMLNELSTQIEISPNPQHATENADVILLCTSSATPVIDVSALNHPALITSISTNAPDAHEVSPDALPGMDVYCDYRVTTPDTAGEMILAQKQGWSKNAIRGDLGELVNGTAVLPDYSRHAFFRSVGLGLEDVQLAYAIYNRK